jgi:hypothetical protein
MNPARHRRRHATQARIQLHCADLLLVSHPLNLAPQPLTSKQHVQHPEWTATLLAHPVLTGQHPKGHVRRMFSRPLRDASLTRAITSTSTLSASTAEPENVRLVANHGNGNVYI